MRILICTLALIWVRLVRCRLAIDIKHSLISRGVNVHYGKFGNDGTYRMYIGGTEPIERVDFGDKLIYPSDSPRGLNYQVIAETFTTPSKKFLVLNSFGFAEGVQFGSSRHIYEITPDNFRKTTDFYFLHSLGDLIYLSLDIGSRPKHPFIVATITDGQTKRLIKYSTLKIFNGYHLDGFEGPVYTIGAVYDSDVASIVGYTETQLLGERCAGLTVEIGTEAEKVIADLGHLMISYEKRFILRSPVWYLTDRPEHGILPEPVARAFSFYDRIRQSSITYSPITLDVSEQITPQSFGIERSTGTVNGWNYVVYELKSRHRQEHSIKFVIDYEVDEMTVFRADANCVQLSVEMFKKASQVYLLITSHIRVGTTRIVELDLFERKQNSNAGYLRIDDAKRSSILGLFSEFFPIVMDVNISDEPKFYYDVSAVGNETTRFQFFQIKENDGHGNNLQIKYMFGNVWENDPYELGNIPREHINKDNRIVKEGLNARKFLIREMGPEPPISAQHYEVYAMVR